MATTRTTPAASTTLCAPRRPSIPDDVRNEDGDEVVDPPESWAAADHIAEEPEGESLDEKLAAEEPEVVPQGSDEGVAMDQINPEDRGTDRGQISGTPEDGDSIFPVVE